MQVKRFEAADMTEALRQVKEEFGDDAVILSAKEIRSGGFFNPLKKKSVEITAAIDYMKDTDAKMDRRSFSSELSKQLGAEAETDRVSLSSKAKTRKNKVSQQKPVTTLPAESSSCLPKDDATDLFTPSAAPEQEKKEKKMRSSVADKKTIDPVVHSSKTTPLVAQPFYRDITRRKIVALVGPCGVGKSTSAAKLAWHCHVNEKKTTALISLDRFRIGGNSLLAGVARVMGIPFSIVHDKEQMRREMDQLNNADVVLIDTPGIGKTEESKLHNLGELLDLANPDEIHLVANATVRDEITAKIIDTFNGFGINRLLFTHMDENGQIQWIRKAIENAKIPSSFYGDGADLFDGLKEIASKWMVEDATNEEMVKEQTKDDPSTCGAAPFAPMESVTHFDSDNFIVNRNSELFHRPNCRSVLKMRTQNVTTFSSMEKAITHGFKPCQACCADFLAEKMETESFHFQRASAL